MRQPTFQTGGAFASAGGLQASGLNNSGPASGCVLAYLSPCNAERLNAGPNGFLLSFAHPLLDILRDDEAVSGDIGHLFEDLVPAPLEAKALFQGCFRSVEQDVVGVRRIRRI